MPIVLRPCTKKSGYEALPTDASGNWDQSKRLDLSDVSDLLVNNGCEVLAAGVLLLVQCPGLAEVSVYPSGRLMIKTEDEAIAKKAAEWVLTTLGLE
jgi:hypothetical protein